MNVTICLGSIKNNICKLDFFMKLFNCGIYKQNVCWGPFWQKEKAQWQEEAQQYNKGWRKKNQQSKKNH